MKGIWVIPVIASILILGIIVVSSNDAFANHVPIDFVEFTEGELSCIKTTFEGGEQFDVIQNIPGLDWGSSQTLPTWLTLTSGFYSNNPSGVAVAVYVGQSDSQDIHFDPTVSKIFFHYATGVDSTLNLYDINDNLLESTALPANAFPLFDTWDPVEVDIGTNEISRAEFVTLLGGFLIDDLTYCVGPDVPTFDSLREQIVALGLPDGVTQSLIGPLEQAQTLLDDGVPQNDGAVCGKLTAFLNEVDAKEGNGDLTSEQADELRSPAQSIQNSLGCS